MPDTVEKMPAGRLLQGRAVQLKDGDSRQRASCDMWTSEWESWESHYIKNLVQWTDLPLLYRVRAAATVQVKLRAYLEYRKYIFSKLVALRDRNLCQISHHKPYQYFSFGMNKIRIKIFLTHIFNNFLLLLELNQNQLSLKHCSFLSQLERIQKNCWMNLCSQLIFELHLGNQFSNPFFLSKRNKISSISQIRILRMQFRLIWREMV